MASFLTEIFIPFPPQYADIVRYQVPYFTQFPGAVSDRFRQLHRLEPELGVFIIGLNVNMYWLINIIAEKEKSETFEPQYSRHRIIIPLKKIYV
jgi:hypothetical protein